MIRALAGFGSASCQASWVATPDVWGADLTVVEREFTLVGVNPALDQFTDLAAQMKDAAHAAAREAGRVLTAAVAA